MVESGHDEGLEVRRSRAWLALWALPVAALVGVGAWFATHPEPLPTSDEAVTASTPVDIPVYVGVFTPTDRTLDISDVRVRHTGDAVVDVLVCRDGTVGVTSDPDTFCTGVDDAVDANLTPGDELLLRVSATAPGPVSIDRVEVSYRDGLQWGTDEAGHPVVVNVLGR
ncbi:MAG TPA: hypothetical protein VFT00_01370 [Nocardioides sp.]|nr:hypothetical protein [Nocardioides sp.]